MDKRILQTYSTWAKENLENQIEVSLKALGINDEKKIKKAKKVGDVTTIEGAPTSYPADLYGKRENIINLIIRNGYKNVIEEFAYTWFNRFVALKFMEVHGFLTHGFRVLSDPAGGIEPEILKNLNLVKDDLRLDMALCNEYKQQGKIEELFRHVLIKQCNVLAGILPMLFSTDMGYLELLLPNNLLKGETVVTRLNEIPESAFMEDVEIIGWMYQFYISSKKDAVYASKKTITKDTLPAVTQLFTPDWIVRYMAQNSVGRLWLESYPNSSLRSEMNYYVEDVVQTAEVKRRIDEIKYKNLNPEDIRIIEPCCGSGHILVYVFDLLYKMYEERGYQKRDIPTLILKNNLVGLDVDKRAAQLASFSLIMKARSANNRFFNDQYFETPHVYELQDSKLLKELEYRKQLKDLNLLNDEEMKLINYLVDTFENGKTIGSLLKVKPIDFACLDDALDKVTRGAVTNLFNIEFLNMGMKRLKELSHLAKVLSSDKYDVMITNPPYRAISTMETSVIKYITSNYPDSKTDLYSCFIEQGLNCINSNGFIAMITMESWMFISSFENLRQKLALSNTIINMVHMPYLGKGKTSLGINFGTDAMTMRKVHIPNYRAQYQYITYLEIDEDGVPFEFPTKNERWSTATLEGFSKIPGSPIAYWVSDAFVDAFKNKKIGDIGNGRQGMTTTDNKKYLRFWFEVDINKIGFGMTSREESVLSGAEWFPHNKGGAFRKWYGNNEYVVYYYDDGRELIDLVTKKYPRISDPEFIIKNRNCYFKEGIEWSDLTSGSFGARTVEKGFIFDACSPTLFLENTSNKETILGFMNTIVFQMYMRFLSPTFHNNICDVIKIPVMKQHDERVSELVKKNIRISKEDWDSFETSWDFQAHPMVRNDHELTITYHKWERECKDRFTSLKTNEIELNRIFIDAYGLQEELTPDIADKDVTIHLADRERDVRSLLSYLVGIVMGRYSLDAPGLVYAGGEWDASKYQTYQPDDDGIIPIYRGIGMEDGLTMQLINLLKLIYGEDHYRQNMDFIAEALGKNSNESSEETLNRYLNDSFYSDHLKIYQKRPIYWLFTSGKKAGFKCLIYMHRYNEDTLARINAKYFLPESTRKKNELDELNGRIAHAEGRDKLRLEKERQNLAVAYNEAIEYGQVLDHMANQYISIDLDDGVKVNYAKFQGVEIVTDGGSKVKKDLLAPLK